VDQYIERLTLYHKQTYYKISTYGICKRVEANAYCGVVSNIGRTTERHCHLY